MLVGDERVYEIRKKIHHIRRIWKEKRNTRVEDGDEIIKDLQNLLDTRETVIAKVIQWKEEAQEGVTNPKPGDDPEYCLGRMRMAEDIENLIRNPKESIPTPQPNLKADNPTSRNPKEAIPIPQPNPEAHNSPGHRHARP